MAPGGALGTAGSSAARGRGGHRAVGRGAGLLVALVVEAAGQIRFIAVALALGAALARLYPSPARGLAAPGPPGPRTMADGVGTLAAFWMVERVAGLQA